MEKEGWSIDITSKNRIHYYKDGVSLCGKSRVKDYMTNFDKTSGFSAMSFDCAYCEKKLNKISNDSQLKN